MVTDKQVRRLMKLIRKGKVLATAAAGAGMDEKTARKYERLGMLPSDCRVEHTWRTRQDPFSDVWEELSAKLEVNPGLQAKTLFDDLQRRCSGKFQDGQLRTLQRKVKCWRSTEGPAKEVFFPQEHHPGCTYSYAYRMIFQKKYEKWSQAFAAQVVHVAKQTSLLELPGLGAVRLDAFIVSSRNMIPSDGHWATAHYEKEDWLRVLGTGGGVEDEVEDSGSV